MPEGGCPGQLQMRAGAIAMGYSDFGLDLADCAHWSVLLASRENPHPHSRLTLQQEEKKERGPRRRQLPQMTALSPTQTRWMDDMQAGGLLRELGGCIFY